MPYMRASNPASIRKYYISYLTYKNLCLNRLLLLGLRVIFIVLSYIVCNRSEDPAWA